MAGLSRSNGPTPSGGASAYLNLKLNGREALTSLLAATFQDGAAIGRGHALAESALAGTFDLGRIVCTFHR